jgi:hypothetical protein
MAYVGCVHSSAFRATCLPYTIALEEPPAQLRALPGTRMYRAPTNPMHKFGRTARRCIKIVEGERAEEMK